MVCSGAGAALRAGLLSYGRGSMALLALLAVGCGAPPRETEVVSPKPVPVSVQLVTASNLNSVSEAVGTVRAKTSATVSSKVMGYIREMRVSVGDRVQAGQPLVVLDARDLEASVQQARAAVEEARSAQNEVAQSIASAKAGLTLAQVTHRRFTDLFEKKSVSNQEFDESKARLDMAQAAYDAASARREQVGARIRQAEQAQRAAEIARGYTVIAAPFAGIVTEKKSEQGNLAVPGSPLLVLEQAGVYRLEASVEESLAPRVRAGQTVSVTIDSVGTAVQARVSEIVPSVDPASRSFIAKIDLPSMPGLRSGAFGRASFPIGTQRAVLIPERAIERQGQLQTVLVADGDVARARLVTAGRKSGDSVEILSGLAGGDRLIWPRPAGVADGSRIEVRQ